MQFHLPDLFFPDLVSTFAFGILAILLIIVGYVAFDKLTPKLDFDDLLNKGNLALAIVIGSFILGLCYVVVGVVSAVSRSQSRCALALGVSSMLYRVFREPLRLDH